MDYTTLNKIRKHSPCEEGWETLLKSLKKTKADDEKLSFAHILKSNSFDDALWCLRAHDDEKKIRLFVADCAERVLHIFEKSYPDDDRPRLAIDAARDFANGDINSAARAAAGAAARDAAGAAVGAAAGDAARAAARAAWAAAGDARAAARDAPWAAAEAARHAEEKEQIKLFKKYFCTEG